VTDKPLWVSFYTSDYAAHGDRLVASLERFALPYHVARVPKRGDWHTTTRWKPEFIEWMRAATGRRPLVWIDADAEVLREPVELRSVESVSAVEMPRTLRSCGRWMAGMVAVGGPDAGLFLADWIDLCAEMPRTYAADSEPFSVLGERLIGGRRAVVSLPHEYGSIDGLWEHPDPVIVHHQASREMARGER